MGSAYFLLLLSFCLSIVFQSVKAQVPHEVQTSCKALIEAIDQKNYNLISSLLESVDPNCILKDPEGKSISAGKAIKPFQRPARSPLVAAARNGDIKAGRLLLQAGAEIDLHAHKDESPLIAASANGDIKLVELLINNGANINRVLPNDGTALMAASREGNLEIVKLLLAGGAEIDQISAGDGTALVNAVRNGHYSISKILLSHGANPTLMTPGDEDPMHHAQVRKDKRMISLLRKYQSQLESGNRKTEKKRPEPEDKKIQEELIKMVRSSMQENDIPALSLGVVRNGEIFFTAGFGNLKRNSSDPVNPNSIYQIASLSKMFTGIISRSLEKENIISLEDPITKYFPDAVSKETKNKLRDVKIQHLLFHKSGLPPNSIVLQRIDGEPMEDGYSRNQLLQDLEKLELEFIPGGKYQYSNLGYAVLGFVLEEASGQSYSELLKKYVTIPFGMPSTTSNPEFVEKEFLVTPYRKDKRRISTLPWQTGKLTPASGIFSNVRDLTVLMVSQMEAYTKNENTNLFLTKEKTIRDKEGSYYGFGIFVEETERGTVYGHRGDMDGFASEYMFNPERKAGVVILNSSGGKWAGLLAGQIMKVLEEKFNSL